MYRLDLNTKDQFFINPPWISIGIPRHPLFINCIAEYFLGHRPLYLSLFQDNKIAFIIFFIHRIEPEGTNSVSV